MGKAIEDGAVEVLEENEGDENVERGNWGSKLDFILSCVGYAVGLGNVWRFPYLAYENGGGAFLVPYIVMLVFAGLPLFFMEVSFGQYCSQGPITCWRAIPMFRGVGYGMVIASAYVGIYYNVIIMYTIYYLFASFTSDLPWTHCDRSWNTIYCSSLYEACVGENTTLSDMIIISNGSCTNISDLSASEKTDYGISGSGPMYDISGYTDPLLADRTRPSEEYWEENVLRQSQSMNDTGTVSWQLALCLLLAWIIVYFCLVKGIKSSGKVVYFTATFPYVVLVILLVRGVTLPGSYDGILFFIVPDFTTLSNPQVWLDAAVQIFFSLSAAWGGLITLSSYNKFHNNCYFDAVLVATLNCLTSVFAGFVIFSIVGFMAQAQGKEVADVIDSGFGLAFIAYPEAVSLMPVSPLWAILFFFMLLTLGLDSQFTIMETVVTALVDEFPDTLRKKKTFVMLVGCCIMYLLGITCITEAGPYWVSLMDSYGAGFSLIMFGLCETIGLSWFYGTRRFTNDIRTMIGNGTVDFFMFYWWPLMWSAVTPGLLLFVLIFNWMNWSEPEYNGPYPTWGRIIGWLMITSSIIWIPFVMIFEFLRAEGNLADRWRAMSNPRETWGPALKKHRIEAAAAHQSHGTSFGGILNFGTGPEPSVAYTAPDNNGYDHPL
ncbi:sodium- and chloride-dependent neutral and basic amino acid transporter B(0+)-like [Strongylocentrotus purpuratus]|uniref:Transporter n=1 Tax=Strongylocentrotus purpuratus TaxID=7668 RepID=A0A7M7SUE4_STRPU|nr:sodium- and chloride-dependent neutral and basic amino acid transporter B(0+)-like [Strongylocentrotus purpuratus]